MKYAFIQRHQGTFTVIRMCEVMEVSPSAYYDWLKGPESTRSLEDRRLGEKVKEKFTQRAARPMAPVVFARNWSKKVSPSAVRE